MTPLDPRLTPARLDLAASHLRGSVTAERFVEGRQYQVCAPVLDLKRRPRSDAGLDTQLLRGEILRVFDEENGWAWVQSERDGYVGYVATQDLSDTIVAPTHEVVVNRTFVYPAADMKQPVLAALPLAARVTVRGQQGTFARIDDGGFVVANHLAAIDRSPTVDVVAVAEKLIGTPYLWGGRTSLGIDCSGLVQLSFAMAGIDLPRDTDMQEAFGELLSFDPALSGLDRGDLVFWCGHVGMMCDAVMLVHANAHHMLVAREPLDTATKRIGLAPNSSRVTSVRRHKVMFDKVPAKKT